LPRAPRLGALGGAALGTLAGGDDRKNALIGAGIGALAGGAIGGYMDQQEAQLRAQLQGTGVSVTRMGDKIILNMPSNITFDSDQSAVKPEFYPTLNSVALVLQKFNRSLVDVSRSYRFHRFGPVQSDAVAAAGTVGVELSDLAGQ
jgi:outer membrane protein OmpA-like peptidoglycan-associated protein